MAISLFVAFEEREIDLKNIIARNDIFSIQEQGNKLNKEEDYRNLKQERDQLMKEVEQLRMSNNSLQDRLNKQNESEEKKYIISLNERKNLEEKIQANKH